jgi:hypothetical protein
VNEGNAAIKLIMLYVIMLTVTTLSVITPNVVYTESRKEVHTAECRYALLNVIMLSVVNAECHRA